MKALIIVAAMALTGCATTTSLVTAPPSATPAAATTASEALASADAPASPTDAASPSPAGPTTYKPGDTIQVTKDGASWATVTITKTAIVKHYTGPYNYVQAPAAGNVYIQALVTYVAQTDGVSYGTYDWQLFADGEAVANQAFVVYGPKPDLGIGTLPKGRRASGYVVYEVPAKGEVRLSYGGSFGAPAFEVVLRAS